MTDEDLAREYEGLLNVLAFALDRMGGEMVISWAELENFKFAGKSIIYIPSDSKEEVTVKLVDE
jgi:hypothetical protein